MYNYNLAQVIEHTIDKYSESDALIYSGEEKYSFRDLDQMSIKIEKMLSAITTKGDAFIVNDKAFRHMHLTSHVYD